VHPEIPICRDPQEPLADGDEGNLSEEVYVAQPPGFTAAGHEAKVLKLHKALYGLKQTPRAWNAKLDHTLGKLDFVRSSCEHGLYTRGAGKAGLVVGIYVDDLIITGQDSGEISFSRLK
jgi:hypothetical protein